jgi:hypothetical protein
MRLQTLIIETTKDLQYTTMLNLMTLQTLIVRNLMTLQILIVRNLILNLMTLQNPYCTKSNDTTILNLMTLQY